MGTVCIAAMFFVGSVTTAPVQWSVSDGGNGHWYEPIMTADPITWEAARDLAVDEGGYLATLTTEAENLFVFSLIDSAEWWPKNPDNGSAMGPWIGGLQPDGSAEPDGGWTWVTGEAFVYTAWGANQPSNSGGSQDFMHYYARYPNRAPTWNDEFGDGPTSGLVIEYETPPDAVEWPTADGGNGHQYLPVPVDGGLTFDEANDLAIAAGGHLVTLTSAEENAFVFGLIDSAVFFRLNAFNDRSGPWIGAVQDPSGVEPAGGWTWITGEGFAFSAWGDGQPNNSGGIQSHSHFWANGDTRSATWNDVASDTLQPGYIIEFDTARCPADLDQNGVVDGADLGLLLGLWGNPDPVLPADLNGDGSIDGADLGLLLGAWGTCP